MSKKPSFRPTKFPKPPAEVFCPGEFIRDELHARKWGRARFAHETRLPIEYVNGLLAGTEPLTEGPAQRIAQVFGTSVAMWNRLERAYRNHLATNPTAGKGKGKK